MSDPVQAVALPHAVDIASVVLGAAQGALFASQVAKERKIDLVGIAMVAIATGLGGGIARDLLLNQVPAALQSNEYVSSALVAAIVAVGLSGALSRLDPLVVAFDALSLGLYLVVGLSKASSLGLGSVPSIFIGILSCTAGGVVRDLLLRTEVAMVTVGSFYAFAAFGGALVYMGLLQVANQGVATWMAVLVTFSVRMLSIWFGWSTPHASALRMERLDASVESMERMARSGVDVILRGGKGFMRSDRTESDGRTSEE
ncbi:TRIC cation channel family protein [Hamadaea sp. NPDC051192]|uniref:trimeric intracellular cation channel family protein n=1 Tax=Hamadaea sp. NPDC051192 TaxID=3154940 RepID=UPI00343FD620